MRAGVPRTYSKDPEDPEDFKGSPSNPSPHYPPTNGTCDTVLSLYHYTVLSLYHYTVRHSAVVISLHSATQCCRYITTQCDTVLSLYHYTVRHSAVVISQHSATQCCRLSVDFLWTGCLYSAVWCDILEGLPVDFLWTGCLYSAVWCDILEGLPVDFLWTGCLYSAVWRDILEGLPVDWLSLLYCLNNNNNNDNNNNLTTLFYDLGQGGKSQNLSLSWQSREELLEDKLGHRHIPLAAVVLLTGLYTLIFLSGVLGNVCTCVVIARNRSMRTATNYYLFSLAVSDVLTLLLALPPEMSTIWEAYPWRFGVGFCIVKSFVSELTSYASVLTITAFTADRYVAICRPLRSQAISSLSRAVKIVVLAWVLAACCALPYPLHTRVFHGLRDPCTGEALDDSLLCNIPERWLGQAQYLLQFSTFAFFLVPLLLITVMYVLIGLSLSASQRSTDHKKNQTAVAAATKARKTILKMLVAVVIAFFVCWAPFHTQRLITVYIPPDAWTPRLLTIQTYIFYISGVLYYFNSTINPILYNVMSRRYRKFFKRTLYHCLRIRHADYAETSVYRSTPVSPGTARNPHGHRLVVRARSQANGSCHNEVDSSTV
ncbi:neuromedin U receptor homolog nmur-2-like [Babylonia areolata]|uniref:neuromedin U receptor homolog nmur-2-like n=1 Tax=Babylonia areolata TaxID=304850 RepID=UPI003FD5D27B